MHEARIQTSVHYPPIHRFTLYRQERPLPVTDDVADRIVTLPLFPHMTDEDVELVASALLDGLEDQPLTDRESSPTIMRGLEASW